jgi:hypothetical protein
MSWVIVNRFYRSENTEQDAKEAVDRVSRHWQNVALDLGYDPQKNVNVEEGDKMYAIAISEELDATMRREPGDWW